MVERGDALGEKKGPRKGADPLFRLTSLPIRIRLFLLSVGRRLGKGTTGSFGEAVAALHLQSKGYAILERNFRVHGGEADLIAGHGGKIVVVEVKTRKSLRFGKPEQAVPQRKARRVLLAGKLYCRSRGISCSRLRGDVVAVELSSSDDILRVSHHEAVLRDK